LGVIGEVVADDAVVHQGEMAGIATDTKIGKEGDEK